jgi:hypothetical protein
MGLAPSENGEKPRKSDVAKVPVPIFSQPQQRRRPMRPTPRRRMSHRVRTNQILAPKQMHVKMPMADVSTRTEQRNSFCLGSCFHHIRFIEFSNWRHLRMCNNQVWWRNKAFHSSGG